jgi:two-component system nitrate/nitrite response regulator NarL
MRLLICDDHLMFSEALASLLKARGHTVVGCPTTPEGAVELSQEEEVDAIICDLHFPGIDGSRSVSFLRAARPDTPIVVLTADPDLRLLREAALGGADGIALKIEGVEELERVLLEVTSPLFTMARGSSPARERGWSRRARALDRGPSRYRMDELLTARERQVLEHLVRGDDTSAIATSLGVGTATIRTHLQNLFMKFGVHSRLELVAYAIRTGIVRVENGSRDPSRSA